MLKIEDNAVFIADSHYNDQRIHLLTTLQKIESKEIVTPQIFLMGDIFDFLSDEIDYFKKINNTAIELINKLSKELQIIYFEGNHDFNLQNIFPYVKVIKREEQPLQIELNGQKTALAHGDIFTPVSYDIYTKIIRNKCILKILNFIDVGNWLTKKVENDLKRKNICLELDDFTTTIIDQRYKLYNCDLVIEGHFHQSVLKGHYINLPSLCCHNKYTVYSDNQFKFISI